MKSVFTALAGLLLLVLPTTGRAETLMYDYYSHLGYPDAFNSRGQPLDDFCAIVQQDRANWHKFGKHEQMDGGDFFFNTAARRALIPSTCVYDRAYFANPGIRIRNGSRTFYVYVRVFGINGQVTRVVITEGAG